MRFRLGFEKPLAGNAFGWLLAVLGCRPLFASPVAKYCVFTKFYVDSPVSSSLLPFVRNSQPSLCYLPHRTCVQKVTTFEGRAWWSASIVACEGDRYRIHYPQV